MDRKDIDGLLADLLAGDGTDRDGEPDLEEWASSSRRREDFLAEVRRMSASGAVLKDRRGREEAFRRIEARAVRPFRTVRRAAVAAAAVIVLGFSAFLLWQPERTESPAGLPAAGPGLHRAELLLPRGRTVVLDSLSRFAGLSEEGAYMKCDGKTLEYDGRCREDSSFEMHTVRVPRGGEYSLKLDDGTRVWLNAGSSLTFPSHFAEGERKTTLQGEAYFEVARDSLRPFVVVSRSSRVEVLGTRFNVAAYEGEEEVRTTLLQGRVKVSGGGREEVLHPGEQAVCTKGGMLVREVDADLVIGYVRGIFDFDGMRLVDITAQLGRWYDVDFSFASEELKGLVFTGTVSRYTELSFILNMLERLAEVSFTADGAGGIAVRKAAHGRHGSL